MMNKKEALEYVFYNDCPEFRVKIDKRKKLDREVLSLFSMEDLKRIHRKKVERWGLLHAEEYAPIKELLFSIEKNRNAVSYQKVLFVGNKHIYWASPAYGHMDYNKSIFADNTPANRRKAEIINRMISKN